MDRELIRLECLRLAQHVVGGRGNTETIATAKEYEHFVMGTRPEAEKPVEAPAKGKLSLRKPGANPFS